jgi:hypothetical protein
MDFLYDLVAGLSSIVHALLTHARLLALFLQIEVDIGKQPSYEIDLVHLSAT